MIKDQCLACKFFNGIVCGNLGNRPIFDQTSCNQYEKGINLKKESDNANSNNKIVGGTDNMITREVCAPAKQRLFSHPFSFSGRIRRLEYGLSILLMYIYILFAGYISFLFFLPESFDYIFLIPGYWFIWAQGAKRCHDRNNSGWYQLIPFYGLWMLFGDGDAYENEYGTDPKGRNIYS